MPANPTSYSKQSTLATSYTKQSIIGTSFTKQGLTGTPYIVADDDPSVGSFLLELGDILLLESNFNFLLQ